MDKVAVMMLMAGWHKSARTDEPGSSIAKDIIDSEDPKHALFCRDLRTFSWVIIPSFDGNSNIFATFIKQKSYQ